MEEGAVVGGWVGVVAVVTGAVVDDDAEELEVPPLEHPPRTPTAMTSTSEERSLIYLISISIVRYVPEVPSAWIVAPASDVLPGSAGSGSGGMFATIPPMSIEITASR